MGRDVCRGEVAYILISLDPVKVGSTLGGSGAVTTSIFQKFTYLYTYQNLKIYSYTVDHFQALFYHIIKWIHQLSIVRVYVL